MALDLSRLSALAMPEKEIEVSILGGPVQKITIKAYDDGTALDISDISETHPDDRERRIRELLLVRCAGLTAEDAAKLVRFDSAASGVILSAVFDLWDEFGKARAALREEAKKKP